MVFGLADRAPLKKDRRKFVVGNARCLVGCVDDKALLRVYGGQSCSDVDVYRWQRLDYRSSSSDSKTEASEYDAIAAPSQIACT